MSNLLARRRTSPLGILFFGNFREIANILEHFLRNSLLYLQSPLIAISRKENLLDAEDTRSARLTKMRRSLSR